jgi:DNA mismatch endonuclease (patch repair protein)
MPNRQKNDPAPSKTGRHHNTTQHRSELMSRVRQKGTAPELIVRAMVKSYGQRLRTNGKGLPGSPDLFAAKRGLAIFVHGCFWHRHSGCVASTMPKTNREYWSQKFDENVARDKRNRRNLRTLGFRVLTVWECQLTDDRKIARVDKRLQEFLGEKASVRNGPIGRPSRQRT